MNFQVKKGMIGSKGDVFGSMFKDLISMLLDFADLFNYREHKPSSKGAVPYPRVDWFDHRKDHSPEIAEEQN